MEKSNFSKLRELAANKLEIWRVKLSTHPLMVKLRLKASGIHPVLGRNALKIAGACAGIAVLFVLVYLTTWSAPSDFPPQALITVEKGESLSQVAATFKDKGIIRSAFWLKAFIVMINGDKAVIAGDYYFPDKVSVFKAAKMVHFGEFGLTQIKVTIPEGSNSIEIAKILEKNLPAFPAQNFIDEVADNDYEGYLFPDTYFFMPNAKISDIIAMMRENFARQLKPYEGDLADSKRSLQDIVTMASIIEEEANSSLESKRIVSGILWKRLSLKMPLQVDAPFQYYNGKNSYTLTKEDLAEDHPYNTYMNKGLPPTPIANPGIDSLRAAIAPTPSEYLYFLSDRSGGMHYAKDFEGHKRNRELYLN